MVPELPRSAALAWWLTAWLRGHEVTDHLLDAVADDAHHVLVGPDGDGTLLDLALDLRRRGATGAGLALPVEGDLLGLGGPPALNAAALDAGEAVLAGEVGVVPEEVGETVRWQVLPAQRRQVPDVGEADRGLRTALLEAVDALVALDVARWRPEAADELMDLHRPLHLDAPAGTPARCVELAGRGLRVLAIVDLARGDDGAAVSAHEVARRREALQPLDRAGRRALVAACSPEAWPGA